MRNWSSNLRTFSASFMHGCQNCILHVRRNNSRKNWCWRKKFTVLTLLNFNQNMLGDFAKVRHSGQNCIPCLQMMLPRKKNNFLEKHIIFHTVLRIWASKLRNLVWKFHARLSKLHSTCTNGQFKKKVDVWEKVYCFYHFRILINFCSEFLRKSTARWSKLHSTSTDDLAGKEEQISWKTHNFLHFFENSSVKFTEIGEKFMHGCKNCILHVQTNNSRKFWCLGRKFTVFITFEF